MPTVALIIRVRVWKQPKCPSTDDRIKKMCCVYNGILLSHKRNAVCSNLDGPRDYYA